MKIKKLRSILALLILLIFQSVFAQVNTKQLINSICDSLTRHYIFPDKALQIASYLHEIENQKAYQSLKDNPLKLATQILKDIKTAHNDPHLGIKFEPEFVSQNANLPDALELKRVKTYWRENNYSFKKVEILPGNIGYISFNLFIDDIEAAKATINAALRFIANTYAVIIDLKENMGGSPQMVSQIESYFFKEKTHMNDLINRTSSDTSLLFADPAKTDNLFLGMPLYILTSRSTFSGAEDFCYAMQKAKRAVIVGETTGGGAHPQMPFAVGQGFVMSIPFARSLNPITKTDWEGSGVVPDIKTTAANALLNAQKLIFRNGLENAKSDKEKYKYQYYINSLLVNTSVLPSSLLPFIGQYGDIVIYQVNNRLYGKNNNNNSTSELKYLNKNLFILDSEAQIEFIKGKNDKYPSIKIYVNDGSVFEEKKIRK